MDAETEGQIDELRALIRSLAREGEDLQKRLARQEASTKPTYPRIVVRCGAPRDVHTGYPVGTFTGELCHGLLKEAQCIIEGNVCPYLLVGLVLKEEDEG